MDSSDFGEANPRPLPAAVTRSSYRMSGDEALFSNPSEVSLTLLPAYEEIRLPSYNRNATAAPVSSQLAYEDLPVPLPTWHRVINAYRPWGQWLEIRRPVDYAHEGGGYPQARHLQLRAQASAWSTACIALAKRHKEVSILVGATIGLVLVVIIALGLKHKDRR